MSRASQPLGRREARAVERSAPESGGAIPAFSRPNGFAASAEPVRFNGRLSILLRLGEFRLWLAPSEARALSMALEQGWAHKERE